MKFNPHRLVKEIGPWDLGIAAPLTLEEDIPLRFQHAFEGKGVAVDPGILSYPLPRDIAQEYGHDAVRIAALTAGRNPISDRLLESALSWAAKVFLTALNGSRGQSPGNPHSGKSGIWLAAVFAARDHVLERGRPYPAFAGLRKAWNSEPLDLAARRKEAVFGLTAIQAFAPVFSRHLLERTVGWPPPSLEKQAGQFAPSKAIRVSFGKGGWRWIVVDGEKFDRDPVGCLCKLEWPGNERPERRMTVLRLPQGWKISLDPPPKSAGRSSS